MPPVILTQLQGCFQNLSVSDPPFGAQETLRAWQKKNHPWLELSDVHKETTENVRITVIPFYMGCRETQSPTVYWVSVSQNYIFSSSCRNP